MIKTRDALSNSYIQTFYPFLISSCFTTLGIWKYEPRLTQSATIGTDGPSLAGAQVIINVLGHRYQWLSGGYDLEIDIIFRGG